jgi:hypothetical protein
MEPGRHRVTPADALAGSLNNLSRRLADLGWREEALAAIEEVSGIYRELAAARPDAFRPDLAMSLNNLSARHRPPAHGPEIRACVPDRPPGPGPARGSRYRPAHGRDRLS